MNPDWQNFLTQHGAVIDAGVVQHFGDRAAELAATTQGTVLCDLSQFGTLRVSGADAQTFLQSMLSNDIREVSADHAQLSSLNTPKGRMLATFLVWRDSNDYLLQVPRALVEAMRKKLSMHVLRAKVTIADISDEVVTLGLSGAQAWEILGKLTIPVPQQPMAVTRIEQVNILAFSDTRFQLSTSAAQAQALWKSLQPHAQPAASVCWDWLTIRAGIPLVLPRTQEQFVAQMVNYEVIGGVNFKKGCYPGQEIVARMQYLGKPKRRMYLAHLDITVQSGTGEAPQAGDELVSPEMEGQASGMIVNAAPAPSGGYDVLAVVQISSKETQTVHWKTLQGAALQFSELPYPLPAA
ncbi:MAG TPA: folate-binding protein YgfZ [Gallionella sp.]|nr:folate-binding protein YgfZ [Gallionella sp.]